MSLEVVQMPLSALKEYEGNAKIHDEANVEAIRASIRRFGNCDPIGVWTNPHGEVEIVEGHGRKMALEAEGYEVADVIFLDHLTDEERRAYALAHNQTTLMSDFDLDILEAELDLLADFDMGDFGFDVGSDGECSQEEPESVPLSSRFGVPPFSILDARKGEWMERKRAWLALGIRSEEGRGACAGGATAAPESRAGGRRLTYAIDASASAYRRR